MSDVDLSEFEALTRNTRQKPCEIRGVLEQLGAKEKGQLQSAMASEPSQISNVAISKWLEARDHAVIWQRVRQHRTGQCSCAR